MTSDILALLAEADAMDGHVGDRRVIRRLSHALRWTMRDLAAAQRSYRAVSAEVARLQALLEAATTGALPIELAPREEQVLVWCGMQWEIALWTARDDGTGRPVNGWVTGWETTRRGTRALRIPEPRWWAPLPPIGKREP